MPKRKAPPNQYNSHHRPRKHARSADVNTEDDTPARALALASAAVSAKLHHAVKLVARALKRAKGFERQRLTKKLRSARATGDEAAVRKFEGELEVLKGMELNELADSYVRKVVGKQRSVVSADGFPEEWREKLAPKEKKGGKKEDGDGEMEKAKNNVVAALCNMNPVKEAVAEFMGAVKRELGLEEEQVAGKKGAEKAKKAKQAETEEEDEDQIGDEEDEDSEDDDNTATKKRPTKKVSISQIDPSRGSDDEWSGGEEDFEDGDPPGEEGDFEDQESDTESVDADDDNGEDQPSMSDSESADSEIVNFSKLKKYIAPYKEDESSESASEDDSGSGSGSDDDSENSEISRSPPPPPTTKSKNQKAKTKSGKVETSPAPAKRAKPTTSTFLPSLMAGYISGSESDDDQYTGKRGPAEKKERKNRMGQMARRKLAEKKFGTMAKHVQEGKGSVMKEERGGRGGRGGDRGGRGGGRGGGMSRGGGRAGLRSETKKDNEGPLHPSWEAAKKAKEAKAKMHFEGKKIKFD